MDIQQQKLSNVLLIGDTCKDIYHFGTCSRLSPEAPVPVFVEKEVETKDGMALNVANNLLSLGSHVKTFFPATTIEKHRFVDSGFNHHILRCDKNEHVKITPASLKNLLENNFLENIKYLIISDYNKGFITADFLGDLSEYCALKNIYLFIDTKKTDLSNIKKSFIKINKKERQELVNFSDGCDFIVTLGSEGAQYQNKIYPAQKTTVYDVCGAGDTFLAGLVHNFIRTQNIAASIQFANQCARIAVSKFGTYVLTTEDVLEIYEKEIHC